MPFANKADRAKNQQSLRDKEKERVATLEDPNKDPKVIKKRAQDAARQKEAYARKKLLKQQQSKKTTMSTPQTPKEKLDAAVERYELASGCKTNLRGDVLEHVRSNRKQRDEETANMAKQYASNRKQRDDENALFGVLLKQADQDEQEAATAVQVATQLFEENESKTGYDTPARTGTNTAPKSILKKSVQWNLPPSDSKPASRRSKYDKDEDDSANESLKTPPKTFKDSRTDDEPPKNTHRESIAPVARKSPPKSSEYAFMTESSDDEESPVVSKNSHRKSVAPVAKDPPKQLTTRVGRKESTRVGRKEPPNVPCKRSREDDSTSATKKRSGSDSTVSKLLAKTGNDIKLTDATIKSLSRDDLFVVLKHCRKCKLIHYKSTDGIKPFTNATLAAALNAIGVTGYSKSTVKCDLVDALKDALKKHFA